MSSPTVFPLQNNDGIYNNFNNCWLSAMLQMFVNMDDFVKQIKILTQLLEKNSTMYRIYPEYKSLLEICQILNKILQNLKGNKSVYNLEQKDYDAIIRIFFPSAHRSKWQDVDEFFDLFMDKINDVVSLNLGNNLRQISIFYNWISVIKCITYSECEDPAKTKLVNQNYNFIQLVPSLSESDMTIQNLLHNSLIDISLIDSTYYCNEKYNYLIPGGNKYLFITLKNIKFINKNIYINPLLFVSFDDKNLNNRLTYIINGAICFTGSHYYYVSFDEKGAFLYKYDDTEVTPIIDVFSVYNEIIFVSYVPCFFDEAELNFYKELMKNRQLLMYFTEDILKGKKDVKGVIDSYIYLQQSITRNTEALNTRLIQNLFFVPTNTIFIGNLIVNSVVDKELYDLFYMGDSMKQKYIKSIELNTEHFKDVFNNNTKSTDKETDIENIYNNREQFFSSTKKSPIEKYSIFQYNNEL